jgi:archaellum component FlaG (FlaF/FlaG flagellin family)
MKNTILIIIAVVIAFGAVFVLMNNSEQRLRNHILKAEKNIRDSLRTEFLRLQSDRDSISAEIKQMRFQLDRQTYQIKNIKIDVPKIDYNAFADSALVQRLLSGYRNK